MNIPPDSSLAVLFLTQAHCHNYKERLMANGFSLMKEKKSSNTFIEINCKY